MEHWSSIGDGWFLFYNIKLNEKEKEILWSLERQVCCLEREEGKKTSLVQSVVV